MKKLCLIFTLFSLNLSAVEHCGEVDSCASIDSMGAQNNDWWKEAVIYQIYPRSFKDSNGDGQGDLKGITSKLSYLSELGVEVIWLSPVYPSPNNDWGYDVANYRDIHRDFGTLEDFDDMLAAAKSYGISVVMDLVVNHTSDAHPWFTESRSSVDNPKRDWYLWREGVEGVLPNNWQARIGVNEPAWKWDETTQSYYMHSFTAQQPDLNWRNPEVVSEIHDIMKFWLNRGVKGFRLDVANYYFKDPEFRNNPQEGLLDAVKQIPNDWGHKLGRYLGYTHDMQTHLYDKDQVDDLLDAFRDMRKTVEAYGGFLLGEIDCSEKDTEMSAKYYGNGIDGLNLVYNKGLTELPWSAGAFQSTINRWHKLMPKKAWPVYAFSNHDVVRQITRYDNSEAKAKLLALMLMTFKGTPIMYYGEEIGMEEATLDIGEKLDPFVQAFSFTKFGLSFPVYAGRDGCRTPMQWSNENEFAGFSDVEPWLPVKAGFAEKTVSRQFYDASSVLSTYMRLAKLRHEFSVLRTGDMAWVDVHNTNVLGYMRLQEASRGMRQAKIILVNFTNEKQQVNLYASEHFQSAPGFKVILSLNQALPGGSMDIHEGLLTLGPNAGVMVSVKKN